MRIREAKESDLPAISAIYTHAVLHGTGTFEEVPPSLDAMVERWQSGVARGFVWLVAEDEDAATGAERVLGYAYYGPFRDRSAYRFTVEDSVYVHPNAQRMGVGRALLGALIEAAAQRGLRQMVALVGDSSNTGSIELHRALGFADAGRFDAVGFKFDRWLDVVFLQRVLTPSA
ncbi:MAG: N-acetyltransferase family protein [Polyangiaceae bacterium]